MNPKPMRADSAKYFARLLLSQNIGTAELFGGTGLESGWMEEEDATLTLVQYCRLVSNAIALSRNRALGFETGKSVHLAEFGFYGYAILSSATLYEALCVTAKFWHLSGQLMNLTITRDSRSAVLRLSPVSPKVSGQILVYAVEEILSIFKHVFLTITETPFSVDNVWLNYEAPDHKALYHDLFAKTPICFNQPENHVRLPLETLNAPIITAHPILAEYCRKQCSELFSRTQGSDPFLDRLRLILTSSKGRFPKAAEAASSLGLSHRSFYRELRARSTSYQVLLDEVRSEIAMKYLTSTELSIDHISDLMGFSETTSFRRAFKNWTGTSAAAFRKQQTSPGTA